MSFHIVLLNAASNKLTATKHKDQGVLIILLGTVKVVYILLAI